MVCPKRQEDESESEGELSTDIVGDDCNLESGELLLQQNLANFLTTVIFPVKH